MTYCPASRLAATCLFGFATLLADRFIDADGRRTVLCRVGQRRAHPLAMTQCRQGIGEQTLRWQVIRAQPCQPLRVGQGAAGNAYPLSRVAVAQGACAFDGGGDVGRRGRG